MCDMAMDTFGSGVSQPTAVIAWVIADDLNIHAATTAKKEAELEAKACLRNDLHLERILHQYFLDGILQDVEERTDLVLLNSHVMLRESEVVNKHAQHKQTQLRPYQ